jgi:hypothetical protein
VDYAEGKRVAGLHREHGRLEQITGGTDAARLCVARARARLEAARQADDEGRWADAYATAHEAYLGAAESTVLLLGFGAPTSAEREPVVTAVAHATLKPDTDALAHAAVQGFVAGLAEARPEVGTPTTNADDVTWALDLAGRAVNAVESAIAALP